MPSRCILLARAGGGLRRERCGAPRGFNLPELMVSLALGLLLLAAFLVVLDRCRREFATNESLAQPAGCARATPCPCWCRTSSTPGSTASRAAPAARSAQRRQRSSLTAPSCASRMRLHAVAPVAGLPAGAHDCGVNFAVDLAHARAGANNAFRAGVDCARLRARGHRRWRPRAAPTHSRCVMPRSPPPRRAPGGCSCTRRRLEAHAAVDLFADGRAPGPARRAHRNSRPRSAHLLHRQQFGGPPRLAGAARQVTDRIARRGAVSRRRSDARRRRPAGRVRIARRRPMHRRACASWPRIRRAARPATCVAVRLWLRIRADTTERGYRRHARAASTPTSSFTPSAGRSAQRRLLIERTVALRNARRP